MPPKKQKSQLGKSILRSRNGGRRPTEEGQVPTTSSGSGDPRWMKYQSITQENDLDAFLRTAELAGTEFTAERLTSVQVISGRNNPYILSKEKEQEILERMQTHRDKLTIPRRPPWTSDMTPAELDSQERESFLEWRRQLAYLEEELEMVVTPFERNLEVWRQLWRVLERSDIVVQIVDARHPLFFRCEDLDQYVKELGGKKTLLLVNKADYLTVDQRERWASYFQKNQIPFLFFSAAEAKASLEEEALEEEMSQGKNYSSTSEAEADEDQEKDEDTEVESDIGDASVDRIRHHFATSTLDSPHESEYARIRSCEELEEHILSLYPPDQAKVVVGLVGYPNVGKSSTINALLGQKKVNVSSTPGKTKHFQTLFLSDNITLCDCPGLVFPSFATTKAEMVVNGVLPIDQLREYTGPSALVTQRIPRSFLEWIYGIQIPLPSENEDPDRRPTAAELLCTFADARGFKRAGQGNPDEARAARVILKDYVNGKLLFCHAPPGEDQEAFSNENYKNMHEFQAQQPPSGKRKAVKQSEGMDSAFFTDAPSTQHRIHTKGKFMSDDFNRVNVYPHQSGYVLDTRLVGGAAETMSTGSVLSSRYTTETKMGKKAHKLGKKRVKDRSWRA